MTFQNNLYSSSDVKQIDDFGIISLMYHRFEENKYPSTNIRISDFVKHIRILEESNIQFINPKNFENELKNFVQVCPVEMLNKLDHPISLKELKSESA